jgi:DNA invertase Pin-like site-specific DNA recombinase
VIDSDLGISAAGDATADREGFKELVAEVALSRVGLILGTWVSRLARDNSAWYQLLDLCSLTGTLIALTRTGSMTCRTSTIGCCWGYL